MRYYSFNTYLREKYGTRVHRLSLNAGFSCPNRDGTLSDNGCIYCNEKGFSRFVGGIIPPLKEQIERSIEFAKKRHKAERFIAYFQNATNTYAPPDELKSTYDIIKEFPDIVGLFISTRPDCIDSPKLDLIESYAENYEVWVEYGLQTVHDTTLGLMNRRHTFKQTLEAIDETSKRNIKIGVHVILGLPGESKSDMLETAKTIAAFPIAGVKFHVFHVLKDTPLEAMFRSKKIKLFDMEEYAGIIYKFIEYLPGKCVILRLVSDAKEEFLVAPEWIKDKQRAIRAIEKKFDELDTFQGRLSAV